MSNQINKEREREREREKAEALAAVIAYLNMAEDTLLDCSGNESIDTHLIKLKSLIKEIKFTYTKCKIKSL